MEELYNKIISSTLTNIYTLSKNRYIYLLNFNQKDKNHLYFLTVALICVGLFGGRVSVDMPLVPYLFFKLKHRNLDICRKKYNNGINIDNTLKFIADGYQEPITIFKDIYEEFYERKE